VATVNGKPIPRSVFWGQLAFQVDESLIVGEDDFSVPEPPLEDKVLVLDILIRMEAAAQEAAREGFEPAGAELDRVAAEAAENYGGLAETEKAVTESGGTMEEFRETAARSAALKNWRDISFLGQARATDEEAEEYYRQHQEEFTHGDEVRAMHIMFPLPFAQSGAPAQRGRVWDKAREALALARGGMNFEDLMVQYMDKTTLGATANGQLGWVGRGASFPELEAALFEMKPGDVSDIVETPFSLHILKAVDARPAGVTPFSEVRPEIVAFLTDFKTDRLMRAKIDELVAQADVKIMDPELAKGWEEFRLAGSLVAEPAPGEADAGD
jgi:parvulin-like peptidyl-prolyl isomerase